MSHVPDRIIQELKSIQSRFLWNSSTPKIKHSTLIGDYAEGGLKNVDINTKFKALKLTGQSNSRFKIQDSRSKIQDPEIKLQENQLQSNSSSKKTSSSLIQAPRKQENKLQSNSRSRKQAPV